MHNNGLRYSIMTPLRNDCVLRSSARLGEAVVSGQVTPDTYVVNRQTGAVATTIDGRSGLCRTARKGCAWRTTPRAAAASPR
jgi:phosphoenolpyruvate synthase/pyruvate phosphate dikinase